MSLRLLNNAAHGLIENAKFEKWYIMVGFRREVDFKVIRRYYYLKEGRVGIKGEWRLFIITYKVYA